MPIDFIVFFRTDPRLAESAGRASLLRDTLRWGAIDKTFKLWYNIFIKSSLIGYFLFFSQRLTSLWLELIINPSSEVCEASQESGKTTFMALERDPSTPFRFASFRSG